MVSSSSDVESDAGEVVIYQAEDGHASLEVRLDHETVWLTQKQMAALFDKDVRKINEHIKNVFKEGELPELSVIRKSRITASDGKTYDTERTTISMLSFPSAIGRLFQGQLPESPQLRYPSLVPSGWILLQISKKY